MKANRNGPPATPVAAPTRLVEVLTGHWANPQIRLIWIGASAGSGKTTLLNAWAGQHPARVVRLCTGPDDADPAVGWPRLASALEEATVPGAPPPLALTREHLADPPAYLHRWLRSLHVAEPAWVVIDDAQHASPALEPLLRAAIDEGPRALRWVVAGRDPLPAVLQRARIHGQAVEIHAGELALTAAECEQCLAACAAPPLDRVAIDAVHAATGGWAAAVVAVAAALDCTAPSGVVALRAPRDIRLPEGLFAYLEAEVFAGVEPRALGVLIDCAWLPFVRADWAVGLSGDARAHEVFEDLARRRLLIERRHEDGGATQYQPHTLLAAFLRRQAEALHAPQTIRQRQADSARLLEADGLIEAALGLDLLSQRWADANRLIEQLAPPAIAMARHASVGSWAERIPTPERSAWVRFWLGQATLLSQPAQARAHLVAALDTFEPQQRDAKLRALAAIVASYFQTYADTEPLATWLQRLAQIVPDTDTIDDPETRATVVVAFFSAVFLRGAPRDEIERWTARVEQVLDSRIDDPNLRIRAAMLLAKHYWYTGRFVRLRALRLRATPDFDDARIVPYSRLLWQLFVQYDCWARADTAGGRDAMRCALDAAQRCAIHLLDFHLTIHAAGFALVEGDPGAARELLVSVGAHCHADRPAEQWHHAVTLAWLESCAGEWQAALDAADAALAAGRRIGPAPTCLALAVLAHAQRGAAAPQFESTLASLRELAVATDNHLGLWHWRCLTGLAGARDSAAAGDTTAALIAGAAAQQLVAVPLAPRQALSQLAAAALRGGHAPPYIGQIIERWKLPPPAEFAVDARWPRPVRIVTLSEFRVSVAGPRADTQREATKRKQAALLQALIAIGPADGARGITLEALADAVWPDADGDAALHALEMAVHRLRAQLGAQAIEIHAGIIALSRRHCWVDAWELVALLDAIERRGARELSQRRVERLVELLRGEFLPGVDAPWATARRDALRTRIAGVISRLVSAQATAEIAPSVRELIRDLARGGRSRAVE